MQDGARIKFAGLPFVASSIFLLLVLFVSRFSLLRAQKYFNLDLFFRLKACGSAHLVTLTNGSPLHQGLRGFAALLSQSFLLQIPCGRRPLSMLTM